MFAVLGLVVTDVSGKTSVLSLRARHYYWAAWILKMGPTDCPEIAATYSKSTLYNIPEERISLLSLSFSYHPYEKDERAKTVNFL